MSNVQIRLLEFGGRVKGRSPLKKEIAQAGVERKVIPRMRNGKQSE